MACTMHAQIERVYCTILQQRTAATHCNTLRIACTMHAQIERVYCTILQQRTAATHCRNTLQHTATHYNTLQHTATHCNTLQHTATHCNTLQHTATHRNTPQTLQHTATHCNTLQHSVVWIRGDLVTRYSVTSTLQYLPHISMRLVTYTNEPVYIYIYICIYI